MFRILLCHARDQLICCGQGIAPIYFNRCMRKTWPVRPHEFAYILHYSQFNLIGRKRDPKFLCLVQQSINVETHTHLLDNIFMIRYIWPYYSICGMRKCLPRWYPSILNQYHESTRSTKGMCRPDGSSLQAPVQKRTSRPQTPSA